MEENESCIVADLDSFAKLWLERGKNGEQLMRIWFTWLKRETSNLAGWTQRMCLPYALFHDFAESDDSMDGKQWKLLSMQEKSTQKFVFHSKRNLHDVASSHVLRHKFAKFLSHFSWPECEQVVITDDLTPYSFLFEEYTSRGKGICGGIILHDRDDLKKAYYRLHT